MIRNLIVQHVYYCTLIIELVFSRRSSKYYYHWLDIVAHACTLNTPNTPENYQLVFQNLPGLPTGFSTNLSYKIYKMRSCVSVCVCEGKKEGDYNYPFFFLMSMSLNLWVNWWGNYLLKLSSEVVLFMSSSCPEPNISKCLFLVFWLTVLWSFFLFYC